MAKIPARRQPGPILRPAVFVMTSTLGLGCSTQIEATVRSKPGLAEQTIAIAIAGADVSMDCPQVFKGNQPSLFGQTDAEGRFHFEEPTGGRWIHDGCDILVEKKGFCSARFPVQDVCVEYKGNHCVHALVKAELVPEIPHANKCPGN